MKHDGLKALIGTAVAGTAALLAYKFVFQPWHLHWGATDEEIDRKMPGDELIESPDYISTRAVTIDTGPERVYPWLIQIGQGRGGAYSYDWIENALGLDIHSVDEIIPELQDLKVGDTIPLEPNGTGLQVIDLQENRAMILAHPEEGWTWDFGLYPQSESKTRLVSRNRFSLQDANLGFRFYLKLVEPGAFIMERKMLLGIKERAERSTTKEAPEIGIKQISGQ
ncbi:MAG: SRPBCC family protein [Pyrinomonadaceae bacterium]|nr:SRPBCC family protein [Pyrinomonadaceae bacterium]